MQKLVQYAPLDSAVDQMGKSFITDSMPPCLNESQYPIWLIYFLSKWRYGVSVIVFLGEKSHSIHGHGETWNEEKNRVDKIAEFEPDTSVKLIRRNCLRLVVEGSNCLIFYNLDNGRIFQEKEPSYLEVEAAVSEPVEAADSRGIILKPGLLF